MAACEAVNMVIVESHASRIVLKVAADRQRPAASADRKDIVSRLYSLWGIAEKAIFHTCAGLGPHGEAASDMQPQLASFEEGVRARDPTGAADRRFKNRMLPAARVAM